MSILEAIIKHGTTVPPRNNWLTCADGFRMSVVASWATYCSPRPDWPAELGGTAANYSGPFSAVEVGFPSERPEPWEQWHGWCESPDAPTESVYAFVPVDAVRALVALHGGEK